MSHKAFFINARNAIRARVQRVKRAVVVRASALDPRELQLISVASLFAGVTLVFMIYVFTSVFYGW